MCVQVHPYLIPVPDVSTRLIDEHDSVVLLATDGVWDVMENDEAVQMATNGTPKEAAAEIVAECARRWDKQMAGRRDDITCLVADLTHPDLLHY